MFGFVRNKQVKLQKNRLLKKDYGSDDESDQVSHGSTTMAIGGLY